jgi:hypothetical protein
MNTQFATGLNEVQNLMWYDGPILSHYRDDQDRDWIVVWADLFKAPDGTVVDIWHAVSINKGDLEAYLKNEITLLQVEERAEAIYVCSGFPEETTVGELTPFAEIPEDRKPTVDSFLGPYAPLTKTEGDAPSSPGVAGTAP